MTTQTPLTLTYPTRLEAEIYLSEDHAAVLHVLADGTTLRLARSRYDLLLGGQRTERRKRTLQRFVAILYWAIRFAMLIAATYHLRR